MEQRQVKEKGMDPVRGLVLVQRQDSELVLI
jgi:hypothetical protein